MSINSTKQIDNILTIPSRTDMLVSVREFVISAARNFGFSEDVSSDIALAVDEACTNIIKHSYHFDPQKEIILSIFTDNSKFEVVITDYGDSFQPEKVIYPDMGEYLRHYKKGGLGIFLMRSLMDEVFYKTNPEKGNEVHLIKYNKKSK